jgi:hypothetical protein
MAEIKKNVRFFQVPVAELYKYIILSLVSRSLGLRSEFTKLAFPGRDQTLLRITVA